MKADRILSITTEIALLAVAAVTLFLSILMIIQPEYRGNEKETIMEFVDPCVILLAFLLFILWFYRTYVSLKGAIGKTEWKSYWAIVGWVIPVISLIIPYAIMKEMFRARVLNKYVCRLWWGFIICGFLLSSYLEISRNLIGFYAMAEDVHATLIAIEHTPSLESASDALLATESILPLDSITASLLVIEPIAYIVLSLSFFLGGYIVHVFRYSKWNVNAGEISMPVS